MAKKGGVAGHDPPHTTLISCTGTTSNSSAAAHSKRCWSLRCSQVNASRAKFRSRSMKVTSRPSRPLGA